MIFWVRKLMSANTFSIHLIEYISRQLIEYNAFPQFQKKIERRNKEGQRLQNEV